MDHGGEAARSTDLGMAGAVQGSQANIGTGTYARRFSFDGFEPRAAAYQNSAEFTRHVRATAGRGELPVDVSFHLHHEPGPSVAYPNIGEFWPQLGPIGVAPLDPQLPDAVVQVLDSYGYSAPQPRPGAGRGVLLAALLPGGVGTVHSTEYALQPRPDAGHGEVLVDLFPDGAGVMYNYNYMWQPSPAAGHGEVFVSLLPGDVDAVYDDYGYYAWQPLPGARSGEEDFLGPLPDGVGAVFDNSSNFVHQTVPGTERADGIAGALRGRNLGAGYDGSGALADAAHNNLGMVPEHLRRLLPFAGIGACSVAVNGLAAGPGSPAVAFNLFVLLLGGLFLVILHVLRM